MLLAIADNAHDDGAQAWPSMTTLIRKTGLAERTVHRAIKQLISLAELGVDYNAGPGLCNLYRVHMTPAPETPPHQRHPRQRDTPVTDAGVSERHPTPVREAPLPPSERHPEPSLEPSMNLPPTAGRVATATATITPIPTAQTFLAAYVDAYRGRKGHDPPSRVKGQLARELRQLSEDGIPTETIKAGFVEWFEANQHPSTLASFVEVAGRGGRPRSRQQANRDQRTKTSQAMAAWANEEGGEHGPDRLGLHGGPASRGLPAPAD